MSETTETTAPATPDAAAPVAPKKLLLSNTKLNLFAPSTAEGKKAALVWDFRNNNPRATVYTRDPGDITNDNPYGSYAANLDLPTFYSFLELMRKCLTATEECRFKIDNFNFVYTDNVKAEHASKVSELQCGRTKDGRVWISVVGINKPRIQFFMVPTEFHFFYHGDGTEFSKAELSDVFTRGYINMLQEIMSVTAVTNYAHVEAPPREFKKKPFNNQGGGNGGGWKNNNGGGYNRNNGGNGGGYNRNNNGGGYNRNNQGGGGYNGGGGGNGNSYNNNSGGGNRAPSGPIREEDLPF